MPSRRSRSRSRSHSNERSNRSPERRAKLPNGVSPINESQYFQKSDEFRLWLKEEKSKVKPPSLYKERVCMLVFFSLIDPFLQHSTLILYPAIGLGGGTLPFFFFRPANIKIIVRQLFPQVRKGKIMNMISHKNGLVLISERLGTGMEQRTTFT